MSFIDGWSTSLSRGVDSYHCLWKRDDRSNQKRTSLFMSSSPFIDVHYLLNTNVFIIILSMDLLVTNSSCDQLLDRRVGIHNGQRVPI